MEFDPNDNKINACFYLSMQVYNKDFSSCIQHQIVLNKDQVKKLS